MPTAAPISQPPCAPSSSFSSRLSTTSRRRRRRPSWPHHGKKGDNVLAQYMITSFDSTSCPSLPPSLSPLPWVRMPAFSPHSLFPCHAARPHPPPISHPHHPALNTHLYIHTGSPLPLLLLLPLLLFLLPPSPNVTAFPVTARLQQKPQRRISTSLFSSSSPSSPPPPSLPPSPSLVASAPTICFPGGGIYFYWQAGAVHYLQQHFNLRQANLVGASAGALTAA